MDLPTERLHAGRPLKERPHTGDSLRKRLQAGIANNRRTISMPLGMVVGALFCRPIVRADAALGGTATPLLIFLMLFFTFCRVRPSQMRLQPLHGWLLGAQILLCVAVYALLRPLHPTLAQGGLICVLAPIAMAAVVIGGMLGANVTTMATFSLADNMAVAALAPAVLSAVGNGSCSFWEILSRVTPLLVAPFVAAQCCRAALPGVADWVTRHSQASFWMWLLSLTVIIGRTTSFILDLGSSHLVLEAGLAVVAAAICLVQFKIGRTIGRRYDDPSAGGQSFGQKNTVLAVWMAHSFLDPIASVAPTAYIVWQNLVNSWQIYRSEHRAKQRKTER